jgi:hypothetical protein
LDFFLTIFALCLTKIMGFFLQVFEHNDPVLLLFTAVAGVPLKGHGFTLRSTIIFEVSVSLTTNQ